MTEPLSGGSTHLPQCLSQRHRCVKCWSSVSAADTLIPNLCQVPDRSHPILSPDRSPPILSPDRSPPLFYLALRRDDGIGEWGRLDGDDDQHRARRKAELSQQPVKEGMYRRLGERLGVKLGHLAGHYETAFSPAGGEEKRPRRRYVKVVEG